MARFTAFFDACVLVPVAPCDTLLRMAEKGAFRPLWSHKVVDEALRALQAVHESIDPSRFQSRFHDMNSAFIDANVAGWEVLEPAITLPDPDDRHVVAAALKGRADVIVTNNLKDFPENILQRYGLHAVNVDNFLLDQFDLNADATCIVLDEQSAQLCLCCSRLFAL